MLLQLVLVLLVLPAATGAQPPGQPAMPNTTQPITESTLLRLTLRDAVRLALGQNPLVQIANLNVAVTQEKQIVARSALLPQASFEALETVQRDNLETFLGVRVQGFPQHFGPFARSAAGQGRRLRAQGPGPRRDHAGKAGRNLARPVVADRPG